MEPVTEVEQLRSYIGGVMERADHHAEQVGEIALALVGAVVWKKDPGTVIEVRTYAGHTTNVLSVIIAGTKFYFRYNPQAGTTELRRGALSGDLVFSFTNLTPLGEVREVLNAL